MKISVTKTQIIGITSVLVMLLLWKLLSIYFNSEFILPPPGKTLLKTVTLVFDGNFLTVVGSTIARGAFGFFISFILGVAAGIWAGTSSGFNAFLRPVLVTLRSVPVISFILLALIWLNANLVPVFIAMLTMFPFICTNVTDGISNIESDLVEMAVFYKTSRKRIVYEVYIPAILPFIISGASSAMGIGWRAIIIGEVLSQPKYGIGTVMHEAQTFLNVDAVIAWTIVAVLISYLSEKLIRITERKIAGWKQ